MTIVVTIAHNAVIAKLHEPSRDVKLEVQRILSYRVEGCEHSMPFKTGAWDGRSSFLDFRAGTFPAGFVHFVTASLRQANYEVRLVRKPLPEPLGPENPVVDAFPEDPRYNYQRDTVRRLVKHGQVIAMLATGAGKSRVARIAYARINRPTLFLTTRGVLMHQMASTFERDLGIPVSILGDGQFGHTDADGRQCVKKMSVGMVQTLVSRLEETSPEKELEAMCNSIEAKNSKDVSTMMRRLYAAGEAPMAIEKAMNALVKRQELKMKSIEAELVKKAENRALGKARIRQQTINLLAKFEFVILEEAHEASGNSYFEILRHCKNAHYRLALTATPFMKEDEEANMRLMACSGPIAIKVTEKTLIDRGILAVPKFKIVRLKQRPPKLYRSTHWQVAYRLGITENEERNNAIVAETIRGARYGLAPLILVQQKAHGETLHKLIADQGLRVKYIQGKDDQQERANALSLLASGEIDALIGTTILDVGVDVPAVGMVILAGGGKAEVATRQRIGRGLRAKKVGPNVTLIVDFDDPFNDYTKQHAQQRLAILTNTPGFAENILPGDFDFEELGLEKKAA